MKTYKLSELTREEVRAICLRNPVYDRNLLQTCQEIFRQIELRDDEAVREYTRRFDGVDLADFRVHAREFQEAVESQPAEVIGALEVASKNIRTFHSSQQLSETPVEIQSGVQCWRAARAINTVGLYVPGGTAPLPSTVLMLGIPAKLAGCCKIVLCVPPRSDGTISPVVLAAAQMVGIRQVFKIGGAQAIASLSLGTTTVPRVDKILGPGNRFVQTAKLVATLHGTAIDMVAGPSEVLVIADEDASAAVVAADLISQAEHGPDSQSILVSTSPELATRVQQEIARQLDELPRSDYARQSLADSFVVLTDSIDEALDFSNRYAPEHLILNFKDARDRLGRVIHAGSVFVGSFTPEVAGDYASGTNHTLPTSGLAKNVSGVSIDSFIKKITFQELTQQGLLELSPTLKTLASVESLEGHARAVDYRLREVQESEG